MKKVFNNIIPFKGFVAITLWPFIFVRSDKRNKFNESSERHERIHLKQQIEMLVLPFYLWYAIEYLIRLVLYKNANDAYYNLSFEQEAYLNQYDVDYIAKRKPYAWIRKVFKRAFY